MTDQTTHLWEQPGYSDVVAAAREGDDVAVEFANGDVVRVPATAFGVFNSEFTVGPGPDEGLNVHLTMNDDRIIDLSWVQIRSASDPFFAQELRRRDAEQSKKVGLRLKALREDRNLSQKFLADAVGMAASQLSKIESGTSDLRVSTVQSLLRTMGAQMSDLSGPDTLEISRKTLRRLALQTGVSADIFDRLVAFASRGHLVEVLERSFGWIRESIVAGALQTRQPNVVMRLKAHQSNSLASPLIQLALSVGKAVRANSRTTEYIQPSADPHRIHVEAKNDVGRVTLESLLDWMWGRSLPVVPLLGKSGFSAAVLNIDDRPVVILKEARDLADYWLFDLAHELGHIALGHISETSLIDVDAPSRFSSDDDEVAANLFALNLLLPGYERMLNDVRVQSQGSHIRFKFAVEDVAKRFNVSAGLLGMVAAYELVEIGQEKDRWGSAINLAKDEGPGRSVAEVFAQLHLSVNEMSEIEATLVRAAVLTGMNPIAQ